MSTPGHRSGTAAKDAVDVILAGYEGLQAAQEAFYKDLHAHPELSHQEHRTAQRAAGELEQCGLTVQTGIGGTGVVGLQANGDGPTVLLRDELDALPIAEDTGADYASTATTTGADGRQVPVAHACGHDLHMACLLAAVKLMADHRDEPTSQRMLDAIKRIVRGECQASGSPREPEFATVASFPLLDTDTTATDRVAAAFTSRFGRSALDLPKQTVSEDFGVIPASVGAPYTDWGIGRTDRQAYLAAEKAGRLQDLPSNHSPKFLPPLQPTLRTGTEAMVAAAMAWLGPE